MEVDTIATVPAFTKTPPPLVAELEYIWQLRIETVPDHTATPPPLPSPTVKPPVMPSPISCTTPDEPGLIISTPRLLEELPCACSTTEPATAASRTTLLVMLSSAVR